MPNFENRTLWIGDNLDVLRGIDTDCVDLIYLDPPFNSKRIYNAPLGSKAAGAQFDDTWSMNSVKREWAELMEIADPAVHHTVIGAGLSHGESMQAYLSFMAPRLAEMHRVLAPTGSIYLHCDPTASHYLKQLMDCIFGRSNFRNEVLWLYEGRELRKTSYNAKHDVLLFYSSSASWTFNWREIGTPLKESSRKALSRLVDDEGRAYLLRYKAGGGFAPVSMEGSPEVYRQYVPTVVPPRDWVHIDMARKAERTGWPTQKPLALLERIIRVSSNEDDIVLDPFCGCGTACIAAEQLGRQWVGIDIDSKAEDVTRDRLAREAGEGTLFAHPVTVSDSPPRRTDAAAPRRTPNSVLRALLWAQLEADPVDADRRVCPPCGRAKYADDFELDHKQPKSKGGPDIDENLWLICGACNGKKGANSVQYLLDKLASEAATLPVLA